MWGAALQSQCRISLTLCCLLSLHGEFGSWSSTADHGTMFRQHLNQHVQGSPGENNSLLQRLLLGNIYLHYAKVSVGWKNRRMGLPRETEAQMLMWCVFSERGIADENTFFWVRKDCQNDVFLSFALTWWWRERAQEKTVLTFIRCVHSAPFAHHCPSGQQLFPAPSQHGLECVLLLPCSPSERLC